MGLYALANPKCVAQDLCLDFTALTSCLLDKEKRFNHLCE